ncbi:hypothetical protein B0H14DRAFT_2591395 [Mycena olivaceomarginata]|nr:hypothetical protein B0H14DRAFT_2591395 [Mycena olivaceomarginata]
MAWSQFCTDTPESKPSGAALPLANARSARHLRVPRDYGEIYFCLFLLCSQQMSPNNGSSGRRTSGAAIGPKTGEKLSNLTEFRSITVNHMGTNRITDSLMPYARGDRRGRDAEPQGRQGLHTVAKGGAGLSGSYSRLMRRTRALNGDIIVRQGQNGDPDSMSGPRATTSSEHEINPSAEVPSALQLLLATNSLAVFIAVGMATWDEIIEFCPAGLISRVARVLRAMGYCLFNSGDVGVLSDHEPAGVLLRSGPVAGGKSMCFGDKQACGFLVLADFAGGAGAMTLGVGNDEVAGPHGISLNTQRFSCLTIAVSEVAGPHGIGLNTRGFSCMRITFKTDALVETRKHTGCRWICVRCTAG